MAAKTSPTSQNAANDTADNVEVNSLGETPEQTEKRQAAQKAKLAEELWGGSEIVSTNSKRLFDDAQLASIDSFDSALEALTSATVVDDFDDFGNGFTVLDTKDKGQLVGVPFVIVEWRMNNGDNGEFVSFTCVTKDGRKLVVNDGSTGIFQQLKNVQARREAAGNPTPQAGLLCKNGLSGGKPYTTTVNGREITAVTYRLAN